MTDERIAIESLGRCTFSPGTWDKKFAGGLAATAEDYTLTPSQRAWLWRLVVKYRRQVTPWLPPMAETWLAVGADERAIRNTIESQPRELVPRAVYADWLDDCGRAEEAEAQRWMAESGYVPKLVACGASYGPRETRPINFEWSFGMDVRFLQLGYYHRSMEKAEASLRKALAKAAVSS